MFAFSLYALIGEERFGTGPGLGHVTIMGAKRCGEGDRNVKANELV